jgi:DNA-binding transcriptional LysR family regulator
MTPWIVRVFSAVIPFLPVAEHRSFTRAAAARDVTPTAVSKAVRQLERRHGVVLFQRTTRSVALTEAGAALPVRLRPAVAEMSFALSALGSYQAQPTGILRLTVARGGVFPGGAGFAQYCRRYPDVRLDLAINEGKGKLASGEFDAEPGRRRFCYLGRRRGQPYGCDRCDGRSL